VNIDKDFTIFEYLFLLLKQFIIESIEKEEEE